MNTVLKELKRFNNIKETENGGVALRSTMNAVYDMFALGAAYRNRSNEGCIALFREAFNQNRTLAMKCLFYIRDCRGGQGERRFFRACFKWLAEVHPDVARKYLSFVPEYGRYDDWLELLDTHLEADVLQLIKDQLFLDMDMKKNSVSLLAKWLPSENASSSKTIARAKKIRKGLNITSKQYRKMLSKLRHKINILESLMSQNRWEEIEFDKIPSKAGFIYRNAFARRDVIAQKYRNFLESNKKVNAQTLYPYEIVRKALAVKNDIDAVALNKYWENLPNYCENTVNNALCVIDTSGSMTWSGLNVRPIDVAISLGLYCAERMEGPFKDYYISFSSRPSLVYTGGDTDFVTKVKSIYKNTINENTNLVATFDLLLNSVLTRRAKVEDLPKNLIIISDMEIDQATGHTSHETNPGMTEIEKVRQKWAAAGIKMPRLVFWNVDARQNTFLDEGDDVTFVSGMSPSLFQTVASGKTGIEFMLDILNSERYEQIV